MAAAVRLGAGALRPLPPQRPGDGRRPTAYVTALGETNEPVGWRANKARGGVLIDVDSGEVISPRVVDAPLAALVRRPALGLRVGRGTLG